METTPTSRNQRPHVPNMGKWDRLNFNSLTKKELIMKYRIIVTFFILLTTSCGPVSEVSPDQHITDTPQILRTRTTEPDTITPVTSHTPSPQPTATFTPASPSIPDMPLSQTGPWWVFFTGEGLRADGIWAVNPDGSGLTEIKLTNQHIIKPRDLDAAISPTGGYIAFVTATDQLFWRGLTLNLLKLPEGEIKTITPLSSTATEPEIGADPASRPPEPLLAITQEASLAWSPDGRHLAFMGAFEGPSSDLYVYSLEDERITRLTDGPSEGIRPIWSPDGRYILHFGVNTLGTGAGYSMAGVWAARADNTGVNTLYDPDESSDEIFVGWVENGTFAVYTMSVGFDGAMNLRTVNIETGTENVLWEGFLTDIVLVPNSGNLLVLVDEFAARKNPDAEVGLYFIGPDNLPWRILEDKPNHAAWSPEASLFFAYTEYGVVGITPNGDWKQLGDFTGRIPIASPVDKELAWYGEAGLWVGNLISSLDQPQPQHVFTDSVIHVSWGPEGQNLLLFGENGLYLLQKPELRPIQVTEGLRSRETAWVWP